MMSPREFKKQILFIGSVFADFRKFTQTSELFAVIDSQYDVTERIQEYGCYCYPNKKSQALNGKGVPVDAIDEACQKYQRCRRCLEIEIELDENVISSWDALNYNYNDDVFLINRQIICENTNQRGLKYAKDSLCACDKEFVESLAAIDFDNVYNTDNWFNEHNQRERERNGFERIEYSDVCTPQPSNLGPADSCCGTGFPDMFPYPSGERGCCEMSNGDRRTFDSENFQCCNGSIIPVYNDC